MRPIWVLIDGVKRDHVRVRLLLRAAFAGLEGTSSVDVRYDPPSDRALLEWGVTDGAASPRQLDWLREALASAEHLDVLAQPPEGSWREAPVLGTFPSPDLAMRALARRIGLDTSPPELASATAAIERLRVRFWRGREWRSGRICSLSELGAFIAAPVAPRRGERIELELTLAPEAADAGARVVQVAGRVADVVPTDATAALGAAGFSVRFVDVEKPIAAALDAISAAVRGVVTLPQPPRRRAPRIPVRWPVRLGFEGVVVDAMALDVSAHGLFIATTAKIPFPRVELAIPVDEGTVTAAGDLVRHVSPTVAQLRALAVGYGVRLDSLAGENSDRWNRFVAGVTRRAHAHVVVAAEGVRREEIFREMSSLGYTPELVDDPGAVLDDRPELVIVDGSVWRRDPRALGEVTRTLRARAIPLVDLGGRPAVYARIMADSLIAGAGA